MRQPGMGTLGTVGTMGTVGTGSSPCPCAPGVTPSGSICSPPGLSGTKCGSRRARVTHRGTAGEQLIPVGCAGSSCRLGLPSCCQAGAGSVSSERFPSRGLQIMHLEQHSLIQVCDLSENQIPVISPAIWPPRTRERPGRRRRQLGGSGSRAACPRASSPSCHGEGREVPGGGVGQKMPQGSLSGMGTGARGCGRHLESSAPGRDRAGGGDGGEVGTPALPRGQAGSRDTPGPSGEGRRH